MNKFPQKIHVKNVEKFPIIFNNYLLKKLRKDIVMLLVTRKTEKEYFDLSAFLSNNNADKDNYQSIKLKFEKEIENLGWKFSYGYGNSALFLYADKKPDNCYGNETLF